MLQLALIGYYIKEGMKKPLLVSIIIIFILLVIAGISAIVLSFKVVRQTTDNINTDLKQNFQSIVTIPTPVPPETKTFDQTKYTWEMETDAGEVIRVQFIHDTDFSKSSDQMVAALEMQPGSDPSLFYKVLPAVITDQPTLTSLSGIYHSDLGQSPQNLYQSVEFKTVPNQSDKVVKITWHLNRDYFINKNEANYKKIYSYPEPVTKALYAIQKIIIEIFSGA